MNSKKIEWYTEVANSLKLEGCPWQKMVGLIYTRAVRRGDNSIALVTEISEILTSIGLKATPDACRYWVNKTGFVPALGAESIPGTWQVQDNSVLEEVLRSRLTEVGRRGIG